MVELINNRDSSY